MVAPVGSKTLPVMLPLVDCEKTGRARLKNSKATVSLDRELKSLKFL
jgi:hypothetical protein